MSRKRDYRRLLQQAPPLAKCADPFRLHPSDDPLAEFADTARAELLGFPRWRRKFQPKRKK